MATSSGEGREQTSWPRRVVPYIWNAGKWCRGNLLLVLTISGVVAGVVLGFALRPAGFSDKTIMFISFPGDMLLRMLKMLIVPLIISCMVTGLSSLQATSLGRMGLRAVLYYLATTFIAIVIGIVLVVRIRPGVRDRKLEAFDDQDKKMSYAENAFLDLIRNIFPSNIVQSAFQHTRTVYKGKHSQCTQASNSTEACENNSTFPETLEYDGVNVLGLITFFTVFGIMLSSMGAKAKAMMDFFTVLNEIIMRMVKLVMWYSPIGITFLITGKILSQKDPDQVGRQMGLYILTIVLGLFIHTVVVLPSIYFALTRKNPFRVMWGVIQAYVTALGTASSSATLPVTFRCLEEKLHIDKRVTRFVLPIGATINMDGTALYEAVAPVFIAQMNGIDLNFGKIITLSITATCASIGAASIPSAGLVTLTMVLTTLGLPLKDIPMIMAVDWFLDRCRTATNVLGDSFGAALVEHLSRDELSDRRQSVLAMTLLRDEDKHRDRQHETVEHRL